MYAEAPLGISFRGVNQIFDQTKDWHLGSAVLIFKILGMSIDTPDTPLAGPLGVKVPYSFSVTKKYSSFEVE